jgi:formylglycine-generating enzyme required for sulfatase activity
MVLVPAGTFIMGDGVAYGGQDEREVTLTRSSWLGRCEVTNREYLTALQGAYDEGLRDGDCILGARCPRWQDGGAA